MAREITIFADTTIPRSYINDIDTAGNISMSIGGGVGNWFYQTVGTITDLANEDVEVKFWHGDQSIGQCKFADIAACDINGFDVYADSVNSQTYMAGIIIGMAPAFFSQAPTTGVLGEIREFLRVISIDAAAVVNPVLSVYEENITGDYSEIRSIRNAHYLVAEITITNCSMGETVAISMDGAVNGNSWTAMDTATGLGNGTSFLSWNVTALGIPYSDVQMIITRTGGTSSTLAIAWYAIK